MSRTSSRIGRGGFWWIAAGLSLYVIMALGVSPRLGVTADEVMHVTGGYNYWTQNDYRLHPENGNLPQRLAALPLLLLDLETPPLSHPGWLNSQANTFGGVFFHDLGNPVDKMLLCARAMIALLGALTVWLIWRWTRGLFGLRAGVVALVLAVFCPALLAHGGLATSDMASTAFSLAAISAFWGLLHRATWPRVALASLACGAAFLAKMSGVLIIPVLAALVIARAFRRAPLALRLDRPRLVRSRGGRLFAGATLATLVAAGSLVVLWAGFGFRYSGFNPDLPAPAAGYYFSWASMLGEEPFPAVEPRPGDVLVSPRPDKVPGLVDRLIKWTRDRRLLPEAYLWGFAQADTFSRHRPAYLNGEYSSTGWPKFFPLAFLLKTTPASLLLFGGALTGWALRRRFAARPDGADRARPWIYRGAPLWIFFGLYWLVAINLDLNIGHRHLLPIYPVFYVLAASAVRLVPRGKSAVVAIALPLLLALHVGESFLARPNYLSYFSSVVGGERQGYRHLVDSSYDWGQGLPELGRWLARKEAAGDTSPVFLSYFGADSPRARGLAVTLFGDEMYDRGRRVFPAQLTGGWYVVSATQLSRVYAPTRGPWTERHEALYRQLHVNLRTRSLYGSNDAAAQARLINDARDYELLQAARLFHRLEKRPPLEIIGGSLLLYHLTDAEVQTVLRPSAHD